MPNYEDLRKDLQVLAAHAERLSTTQENKYFYNQLSKLLRDSACLISVIEDRVDISKYSLETKNPLISLVKFSKSKELRRSE